jgi:DegV family protein with EDD domain
MKLGIATDSTCDLPQYLVERHGLEVVPSILILDGREYADGSGLSRQEFYTRLPESTSAVTTAVPSLEEFRLRYVRLLDAGCDRIVSIHAARGLTALGAVAQQAAREFGGSITVIDSQSLSLGLGFQVLAAAEAAESGLDAVLAAIESTRRRLHVFATLDTLQYARRSGRIPAALSMFGGLLHLKPMLEIADGSIKAVGAVRTTTKANQRMAAFFDAGGPFERLAIMHSGAEPRAREFLEQVMRQHSGSAPRDILMVNVTPVIGAHVGPNGLGFAAVKA